MFSFRRYTSQADCISSNKITKTKTCQLNFCHHFVYRGRNILCFVLKFAFILSSVFPLQTFLFVSSFIVIQVLSSERKFYTRKDLARHRRTGDQDDTSYRGHPLCEFCDERYFDNDELHRHLRKDHYFCHFCETDGVTNQYYG